MSQFQVEWFVTKAERPKSSLTVTGIEENSLLQIMQSNRQCQVKYFTVFSTDIISAGLIVRFCMNNLDRTNKIKYVSHRNITDGPYYMVHTYMYNAYIHVQCYVMCEID